MEYEPGQRVKYFPMVRSTEGIECVYLEGRDGMAKVQRLDMKHPTVVNADYIAPCNSLSQYGCRK